MKKNYFLIILNFIGYFSIAQSQFTSSNCFQLNDSSRLGYALVYQNFDNYISQTSNNFNWNFSNLGYPGPWGSWVSPTTPYNFQPSSQSTHVVFQSTQINEYSNVAFARDHFFSYSPSNDTLYFYGYYAGSDNKYYTRIPYLSFPLSYQDSIYTYTPQKVGSTVVGSVTRYWIYDGFGTVNFSYGSANNVYRIRTKQIDSSYINSTFIGKIEREEMIWFRQSDGIPVLRFEKKGTSNIDAYYAAVNYSTGLDESSFSKAPLLYPNPSDEYISIKPDISLLGVNYKIYDSKGNQILTGTFNAEDFSIDIGQLDTGLYFIQLETESKYSFKIIKE